MNNLTGLLQGLATASLLLLSACSEPEQEQPTRDGAAGAVSAIDIINADARHPGAWLSHGRTYAEDRFSPLARISSENVESLGLSWAFDFGTSRGIEATPIVHDGVMYVTATWNIVYALDARTGAEIWRFDPEVDRSRAAIMCCDVVNRGVAIWGDKVYTGTIDGRLIALDMKNGQKVWDKLTVDLNQPYSITGAPRVISGKVIIGNGGAELGVRGYVSAYDTETGDMVWRFHTVPGNPADGFESPAMERAAETWTGTWWTAGGGGTVWDSMAYDPDLNLLYIGVGNGSPWSQAIRSPDGGDNLFLSSIVALDADTGAYAWHYQTTPGETWDYTATQHMILAEIDIDGTTRKVIMQAPKNGFFYVIDRETGTLISAQNYVPTNWATHVDMASGRPVEIDGARWPGKKAPYMQLPGPLGGHNWHPMSYSPVTGLVYIPAQEAPFFYGDDPAYSFNNKFWNTGANLALATMTSDAATIKAVKAAMKGRLLAWDPVKQEMAWSFEHGGPWNGGVLSTAGNLVFQGAADAHFAAYDARTGDPLWRFFTQTGIVAAPISFELNGTQYISVATGWGGSYTLGFGGILPTGSAAKVGRVLTFKLDASGALPALEPAAVPPIPDLPQLDATDELLALGTQVYGEYCSVCHGDQGISSGLIPSLRHSYALGDAETWKSIVREGGLLSEGMPNFATAFDDDTAEAVRAYMIFEANRAKRAPQAEE